MARVACVEASGRKWVAAGAIASSILTAASTAAGMPTRPTLAPMAAAQPIEPQSTAPSTIVSAVVRIAGPSVYDRFVDLAGAAPSGPASRARAAKLRPALDAADADVIRRQAPVVAAARRSGVTIVSRYRTVANALLVHGSAAAVADLARAPGVVAIEPAPRVGLDLARSVPRIRADAVAARLGFDGAGTVVAVIDSGIDYTHAHFGGPGTSAAYQAAAGQAETIADTWEGRPLFPTDKVVGGWDFVGPKYTHPSYCGDDLVRAGRCVNVPQPDPDPLDQHNHGTHVAGIVAGRAVGGLADGVAPGARLVALKIYGTPPGLAVDEEVDVVVDAIEWCVNVNLARPVPGIAPPHVDVINMSLGEPFGQGSPLFDAAVEAAAGTGIAVAASAGNAGNRPFVLNAPSASPRVLSVASSIVGGDADAISDFSARGPGKHGALKPDVTAPGSAIFSASRGSGSGGVALSGTSMSSPHAAGALALLRQRERAARLGLEALDLAALLMNHADSGVAMPGGSPAVVGVTRQGAGRIDVLRAATGRLMARAGDIASLNLGAVSIDAPGRLRDDEIAVRNLSDAPLFVVPEARFAHADDVGEGMAVIPPDEPIEVPARGLAIVDVGFLFEDSGRNTGRLRDWSANRLAWWGPDVLDALELDGYVTLRITDADGRPVGDAEPGPSVPFYALPRRASRIAGTVAPAAGAMAPRIVFDNQGFDGTAELFAVPVGGEAGDPDEPDAQGEIDVAAVGVRYDAPSADPPAVTFGVTLHAVASAPQATAIEIYVDADRDGAIDRRIRAGAPSQMGGSGSDDRIQLGVTPWDGAADAPSGAEAIVGEVPSDLHTRVRMVRVPLAALGLGPGAPFDFYVVHRGLNEDWLDAVQTDVAPDGADRRGGPRFRVEPAAWRWIPGSWSVPVGSKTEATVDVAAGGGDAGPSLLVLYPDNRFEPPGAQHQRLALDGRAPFPRIAYLPIARRAR